MERVYGSSPALVTGILQVRLFEEVRKQLEVSGQPQCTVLPAGGVSGSRESRCFWRLGLGEWEGKCLREHMCVVGHWARDDLKPDALHTHLSLFLTTRKANLDYSVYR